MTYCPAALFFFVRSGLVELDGWVEDELVPEAVEGCVDEDWLPDAPWLMFDVEFTSVDVWLADVELFVVLLPLPMFTPGLTFALALRSVLLTPTFAFRFTFGSTLIERWVLLDAAVPDGVAFETPVPVVVLVLGATAVLEVVPPFTVLEPLTLALPLVPAADPFE